MNILVFNWQCIKNPKGGGAEVHFHEIFKRIVAKGHSVTLFCSKFKNAPEEEFIDGIKIIRKGSRNTFNFHVPFEYFKKFKKENYDIIIDDINKIPFYTPLFVKEPLLAISHHFFGKSIFKEAGLITGTYVYLSEKLVDFIYKHTKFAVVSQSTLDEFIERGFDKNNFSIVTNAIAQESFPLFVGTKNAIPTITYFGRLKKYKSVDHLVRAYALIVNQFDNIRLEFIGRGDFQNNLEKLCKELGIAEKTIFHGFVSDETKIALLANSHIVVNTSMKEGWGITNIEANACGTPVISANVPGLKDSVSEGISGLLYEYGNISELSEILLQILKNNDLRKKLSNGAVDWAKLFSWDISADKMITLLEQIIDN
jgi:glycosyltransferase involved in cell wall biosynthesis